MLPVRLCSHFMSNLYSSTVHIKYTAAYGIMQTVSWMYMAIKTQLFYFVPFTALYYGFGAFFDHKPKMVITCLSDMHNVALAMHC